VPLPFAAQAQAAPFQAKTWAAEQEVIRPKVGAVEVPAATNPPLPVAPTEVTVPAPFAAQAQAAPVDCQTWPFEQVPRLIAKVPDEPPPCKPLFPAVVTPVSVPAPAAAQTQPLPFHCKT
jgi:hypothetical protein